MPHVAAKISIYRVIPIFMTNGTTTCKCFMEHCKQNQQGFRVRSAGSDYYEGYDGGEIVGNCREVYTVTMEQ